MILESLVAASCFYGNNEACTSGLNSYVKYNKIDEQAQVIERNIKKSFPATHTAGIIVGTAIQRKYNFCIYGNLWYNGDYSNLEVPVNMLVFKYSF